MVFDPADTPSAHGLPLFDAVLKRAPEDFRVVEELPMEPDGAGEHLWIYARKRLLDTATVVNLLQRVYGAASADVGVSGLKDHRAVTEQWFSVRTPLDITPLEKALEDGPGDGPGDALAETGQGQVELLRYGRHSRKLRRGTHRANRFAIILRDVQPTSTFATTTFASTTFEGVNGPDAMGAEDRHVFRKRVAERVRQIGERGFPNFFGPQRFGRDGRNVERALRHFRQPRKRLTRTQRSLYLSSARSALFNRILAARVRDGSWQQLQDGEPAMLAGTHGFFLPGADGDGAPGKLDLEQRLADGDIHPSAPWWGRGKPLASGDCLARETAWLDDQAALREGLEKAGLEQARRATRVLVSELESRWVDDESFELAFSLPSGSFATSLLGELGNCHDSRHRASGRPLVGVDVDIAFTEKMEDS